MAFQEFGPVAERYRVERQQKKRKRIIIAGSSAVVLLLVAFLGFVAVAHNKQENTRKATPNSSSNKGNGGSGGVNAMSKIVKAMCSSTDFRKECETSLTSGLKNSSSPPEPKDLIKAAVSVIHVEMKRLLSFSSLLGSNDSLVKGAREDCKELFGHAADELERSLATIERLDLKEISKEPFDLRTWLSAVISYQQTCVDGFPEGEAKKEMENAVNLSRRLTSNALAMITQLPAFLSSLLRLKDVGLSRRLMSEDSVPCDDPFMDVEGDDGLPTWVEESQRRIMKEKESKMLKPNVVVAKDGSGNFKTITGALNAMPKKYSGRYVIYVKEGIYDESPTVTKDMPNVTIYGDGSRKTIVTGRKNFVDGTRTFQTATFAVVGEAFMAIAMGFRNTAGAIKHQAVALRVQSDRSVFLNCRMEGYQDTLYAQTHRQYYRSCVIAGTVDFVFGDAAAVFQNCVLLVRRPLENQQNIVTAQGRMDRRQTTGFVIQACRFEAEPDMDPKKFRTYLARPWKEYSRTVVMESLIGSFVHPDGYMPWEGDFALKTLYYAEYANKGGGADVSRRVKWPGVKVIKRAEALGFTVDAFIQGHQWIRAAGVAVPVKLGLYV